MFVLSMKERPDTVKKANLTHTVFLFTTETPQQVDRVIAAYENGEAPADPGAIRRF